MQASADGKSVRYTPAEDFVGADRFTYTVDGIMQATVTINVIRRVRDDQYRVAPGSEEQLRVLVNDLFGADYQGGGKITGVTASPAGAQLTIAEDGGSIWYVAPADFAGTDRFVYTVLDLSLPSTDRRLFTMDLTTSDLLWTLHVTHGEASADPNDPAMAIRFSNIPESHMSSLGIMRTAGTCYGSNGYSMRLDGLEAGYNDNVRSRAIVVHPWEGARPDVATTYGYLGLSWGCPAIDDREATDLIDDIPDGTLYFAWYPDGDWSRNSTYLP